MSKLREMLLAKREDGEADAERWAEMFISGCRRLCDHTAKEHADARLHLACVFLDLLAEVRATRAPAPPIGEYCPSCGDQLDGGICGNSPRCERAPCSELREALFIAQDYAAGIEHESSKKVLIEHLRAVSCALLSEFGIPDASGVRHRSS